jgi:hypothetical protein
MRDHAFGAAGPERFFADRYGLTPTHLERLLGWPPGESEYADIFIEHQVGEELALEDGVVKASLTIGQGPACGPRRVRTGYAYTDDLPSSTWSWQLARPRPSPTGAEARRWPLSGERRHRTTSTPGRVAHRRRAGRKVELLRRVDAWPGATIPGSGR